MHVNTLLLLLLLAFVTVISYADEEWTDPNLHPRYPSKSKPTSLPSKTPTNLSSDMNVTSVSESPSTSMKDNMTSEIQSTTVPTPTPTTVKIHGQNAFTAILGPNRFHVKIHRPASLPCNCPNVTKECPAVKPIKCSSRQDELYSLSVVILLFLIILLCLQTVRCFFPCLVQRFPRQDPNNHV